MHIKVGLANKRDLDELYKLAEKSARLWGLSGTPQFISSSENIVYRITGRPECILRLTEDRHRSLNSVRAEMAFMQFLSNNDISVAPPIASLKNKLVENIDGYHVCVFEKASGKIVGKEYLYTRPDLGKKLGILLGKIHLANERYKPSVPWLKRHRYRDVEDLTNALDILPIDAKEARTEYKKAISWYDNLPKETEAYGLMHMDAHGDNIFINDKKQLTLIDFDDCAYNFYAYDLAVVLYYLDSQDMPAEQKQLFKSSFIKSYLQTYPLPQKWIDMIDGFIRLRIIELYIWGWKMFGRPTKDGKTIHFLEWRNNSIDIKKPYPKLCEQNKIYIEPIGQDSNQGILYFNSKSYSCMLGKNGLTPMELKVEGDKKTPEGEFPIRRIFYRRDKINTPNTKIEVISIKETDGWCNASESRDYNSLISLPHSSSHEKMWREDDLYDLVIELGYNDNPAIANKGSAIFIHVMHPDKKPTDGCISLEIEDLKSIISKCDNKTEVIINK